MRLGIGRIEVQCLLRALAPLPESRESIIGEAIKLGDAVSQSQHAPGPRVTRVERDGKREESDRFSIVGPSECVVLIGAETVKVVRSLFVPRLELGQIAECTRDRAAQADKRIN